MAASRINLNNIKCILLDIEGTICPISFVRETLFPYALTALPTVLATQWTSAVFQPYRDAFPESARASPEALQAHVEDLTARDVKAAPLKNLQGYLWETGYRQGAYSTPLFADVVPALKRWKGNGRELVIYSSGSVFAQKLLFEHVGSGGEGVAGTKRGRGDGEEGEGWKKAKVDYDRDGVVGVGSGDGADEVDVDGGAENDAALKTEDLTSLISAWFDTTNAGPKTERSSYEKIAKDLKRPTSEILFMSDSVKEVDAAIAAGMESTIVDRPGNAALVEADLERLAVITSFGQVDSSGVMSNESCASVDQNENPNPEGEKAAEEKPGPVTEAPLETRQEIDS